MKRSLNLSILLAALGLATHAHADVPAALAQKLLDDVTPSLVGVQFNWEYEFGRIEFVSPGVVVNENGTVMIPLAAVDPRMPDEQIKDFKIIVPQMDRDDLEIDATFIGRDERTNVAFVRAKEGPTTGNTKQTWKPVKFEAIDAKVGEPVISVGLLAKAAGYRSYVAGGTLSAKLRGDTPQYMTVGGGFAGVGAPVFNGDGKAIGYVNQQERVPFLLYSSNPQQESNPLLPVVSPPHFFTPASDFLLSLQDMPKEGEPQHLPWVGVGRFSPLKKELAEFYGLEDKPAVEVTDVVPDSPAEKAGLKPGQILLQFNGKPLERGDSPDEVSDILVRNLGRQKVGDKVSFSVVAEKGKPPQDLTVTLGERPKRSAQAKRLFWDDLGFGAREAVFEDLYYRKLPLDSKGVVVSILKPQGAAQNAKLARNDLVTKMNSTPVTDLEQFKKDYEAFRKNTPQEPLVLVVTKPDGTTQTVRIEAPR